MDEVARRFLLDDLTARYARAAMELHRARRRIAIGDLDAISDADEALAECYGLAEQMTYVCLVLAREMIEDLAAEIAAIRSGLPPRQDTGASPTPPTGPTNRG